MTRLLLFVPAVVATVGLTAPAAGFPVSPGRPPTNSWPTNFGSSGLLMSYCRTSPCSQSEK